MYQRKSTPDLIADQLRSEIFLGTIAGGEQLKQSDIAERFSASIVPVREAFQRLINDGLAVSQHNKGVTVTPVSEADFTDIAELRELLEPHALSQSAPHLEAADYELAVAALHRSAVSSDLLERAALHWEFHRVLYAKCQRPRLISQIANLHLSINRYLLPMWSQHGLTEDWDESHMDIIKAVQSSDIERAQRIIVEQIHESRDRILAAIGRAKSN